MPHAEDDSKTASPSSTTDNMVSESLTNGEKPNSLFISHLTSYPVVSDGITTYKSNPYGAKSLTVASDAYNRFFLPVTPYFKTPYSYLAPYLAKADSLGDQTLSKIDAKAPIVKEETASIKEKVTGVAYYPFSLGAQGKDYVFKTFEDEKAKTGKEGGIIPLVKAVLGTEMKVTADTFQWLASFLSAKTDEGKKFAHEKMDN